MPKTNSTGKRGWHGNSRGHARAGRRGGTTTAKEYGPVFYSEIGRIGGSRKKSKSKKETQPKEDETDMLDMEDF